MLYCSINCFRLQIITHIPLPIIDYADVVYQNTAKTNLKPLIVIDNIFCRFVLRCPFRTHHCHMYQSLNQLHWFKDFIHFIPYRSSQEIQTIFYFLFKEQPKKLGGEPLHLKPFSTWNGLPRSLGAISSFHQFQWPLLNHLHTS